MHETARLPTALVIRPVTSTDLQAIVAFVQANSVTYRWAILEGRHPTPPVVTSELLGRDLA